MAKSDLETEEENELSFLHLPWEDVLIPHILPYLSWADIFRLRSTSRVCQRLVNEYCSHCRSVDLSSISRQISNNIFQIITSNSCSLTKLILKGCKELTDEDLLPVIDSNPGLLMVDLSGCTGLTCITVQLLALRCKHIKWLSLMDCYWMTSTALNTIATNCLELEYIDLRSCWYVEDEAVRCIPKHCHGLKTLHLSKIYGITNSTLETIAYHCRQLQHLSLVGCWRVNDDGIRLVGEYCRNLKRLEVKECRDVSEASLGLLRDRVIIDQPVYFSYERIKFLRELGLHVQI